MRNSLLIILLAISFPALSSEFRCGETEVSITKTGEVESTRFHVVAQLENRKTELWLSSVDYVKSNCILDGERRNKILINAYCGGSGCSEHTYTIISARTLMVELVPVMRRSNLDQAEEIIGKAIVAQNINNKHKALTALGRVLR